MAQGGKDNSVQDELRVSASGKGKGETRIDTAMFELKKYGVVQGFGDFESFNKVFDTSREFTPRPSPGAEPGEDLVGGGRYDTPNPKVHDYSGEELVGGYDIPNPKVHDYSGEELVGVGGGGYDITKPKVHDYSGEKLVGVGVDGYDIPIPKVQDYSGEELVGVGGLDIPNQKVFDYFGKFTPPELAAGFDITKPKGYVYFGKFASAPRPGAERGEEFVGGMNMTKGYEYFDKFVPLPRPGAGLGKKLVDHVFRGEDNPDLLPDALYNNSSVRAKGTVDPVDDFAFGNTEHAIDIGDGYKYDTSDEYGKPSRLPVAGIMAASAAVIGLAAGPASPAVAFGLYTLLIAGLSAVLVHVRRA